MPVTVNYQPLLLGQPGRPTCPDVFNETGTLYCPGCRELQLQVSEAAVYLQFGEGEAQPVWRSYEEPYLPTIVYLPRTFDAVRVRNFTAGVRAQVILIPVSSSA